MHFGVRGLHLFERAAALAPIVFQVIHAPAGVGLRVLLFVAEAAFITGARFFGGRRIDAKLQAFTVNIIGESFHVGKFVVGMNDALSVTLTGPRIIDDDVFITGSFHAARNHGVGLSADGFVVNAAGEMI